MSIKICKCMFIYLFFCIYLYFLSCGRSKCYKKKKKKHCNFVFLVRVSLRRRGTVDGYIKPRSFILCFYLIFYVYVSCFFFIYLSITNEYTRHTRLIEPPFLSRVVKTGTFHGKFIKGGRYFSNVFLLRTFSAKRWCRP